MGVYGDVGNKLDTDLADIRGSIVALGSAAQASSEALNQLSAAYKDLDTRVKVLEQNSSQPQPAPPDPTPPQTLYGVPDGYKLTDYNDPNTSGVVTLPDGFKGDGLRFHGIVIAAGKCEITNSIMRGPKNPITSGNHALFRAYNKRSGQAVFSNVTFAPQTPSNGLDCILGWQYELYHCDLFGGVDGMGIYATSGTGSNSAKVTAEDVWVHDLTYFYPDNITTSHKDGTHNDCVQIQGGTDISLKRLKLEGTTKAGAGAGTNPDKPWLISQGMINGACLTVQVNTGINIANLSVTESSFMGGLAECNFKPNLTGFEFRNNQHYRQVAVQSGKWAGYWIRFDDRSTCNIAGFDTNVWVDGPYKGQVLTSPRDKGVMDNKTGQ